MRGSKKFYKYSSKLLDIIYPWYCAVCGAKTNKKGICHQCEQYLPWCDREKKCEVCGLPISANEIHTKVCGQCQTHPPEYDYLSAVFWYEALIREFITQYKYFNRWEHARTLMQLSLNSFPLSDQKTLFIPVPNHTARVRQRGFSAVNELIKLYKKEIKFQYNSELVSRTKNTASQTGKTKTERKRNLRHAFKVNGHIKHKHIVIIDEVVTTGATVNELSRCLKKAGVEKVSIWALARTRYKFK